MLIKGQMLADDRRDIIFFLCSPWLTDLDSAAALGLSLGDFAIHDPVADFLFLLQSKTTALSDANRLAAKLKEEITERNQAQEALRESETKFRTLAETMTVAVFILRGDKMLYANSAAETLSGYRRGELLEMNFWDAVHPEAQDSMRSRAMAKQRGQPGPREREVKIVTKAGEERWVEFRVNTIQFEGKPAILGAAFDVTERKRVEETVRHLAYHDALTDLPNRTLLKDRLAVAIAQARRNEQMLAVMFLDLDRFKVVNDTAGHTQGDELLKIVGEQLKKLVREGDTVARLGGDEFVLLLPEIAHAGDATEVAQRILKTLGQPQVLSGHEFHITASIGITIFPTDGDDAESLLTNADIAMYHAKGQGRNNYQFYTPALNASVLERLALENDLRHGLERDEFIVHYQPQVNISTGQIVGVEALLRWQHPDRGLVMPMEFIPVAEETGLIVPLGQWVLRTACAQTKAWQDAGLSSLRVAVNLSSRQFQQRDLAEKVRQVLQETGLDPTCLLLEITEGVAIQEVDYAIMMLRHLKELGVQIAIDDFGTGYSSLSYLRHLPIDVLKIDRSFVDRLTSNPKDAAITATVITMAHNLGLAVIAEGVETEEQLAFLKQHACDEMQGHLFSKPVSAEALQEILVQDRSLVA